MQKRLLRQHGGFSVGLVCKQDDQAPPLPPNTSKPSRSKNYERQLPEAALCCCFCRCIPS